MSQFEDIVNHLITQGFVYRGSEIYGGLANTWDFGPLGVELKNNIKNAWWRRFIQQDPNNVGLDSSILLNPKVWEASGHIANFSDPLVDCRHCRARYRADKLFGEDADTNGLTDAQLSAMIKEQNIACPRCGHRDFTDIRRFNLMFKTELGVLQDSANTIHLRPETAQGIFINFNNIARSSRKKLPFGVGQIGKVFRNEITPGNFIFRLREFEQAELEFFCHPDTDLEWYQYYRDFCFRFLTDLGVNAEKLRIREHSQEELAHYSRGTSDIEYLFPFGWGEVYGISDRTDFDLKAHNQLAVDKLDYFDPDLKQRIIPYVVEPSLGLERCFLMVLCDAYRIEEVAINDTRIVLGLHPYLAPIKAAIMPLDKRLSDAAKALYQEVSKHVACAYEESGSIGKRYRRHDAIGTPFCITVDHDTATDGKVTIRLRDTMAQERVALTDVVSFLQTRIYF